MVQEAADGLDALRILQEGPVDLVVADIMMPNLSGLELAQWMRRNPELAHIPILFCSCVSEVENILGAAALDRVDYLVKPVDATKLLEKAETMMGLRDAEPIQDPSLAARRRNLAQALDPESSFQHGPRGSVPILPTLSKNRQRILELFSASNSTAHDFARAVSADPGLATTVLRLVNASLQPLNKQVDSISEACVLIGVRNLREICLGAALAQEQFAGPEGLISRCWRYCVASSHLAGRFASVVHPPFERDASLAGLLQGIGLIRLLSSDEIDLPRLIEDADEQLCDLAVVESVRLGYHHGDVSRRISEQWRFRPKICEIIGTVDCQDSTRTLETWCVTMATVAVQIHDSTFVHRAHPEEAWETLGRNFPELTFCLEEQLPSFLQEANSQLKILK